MCTSTIFIDCVRMREHLSVIQIEDHVEKLEGNIENLELNIQKLEEEKKSRDNQIRVSPTAAHACTSEAILLFFLQKFDIRVMYVVMTCALLMPDRR